jgi:DNA helicase MCM8
MQSHAGGGSSSTASSGKRSRDSWEGGGQSASTNTEPASDSTAMLTLQQRLRRMIDHALQTPLTRDLVSLLGPNRLVPVDLMRRYIEYAKQYVHPHLSPAAAKVLQRLYLTMRSEASAGQSIPVTTRHLESLIRLAQARARIDLRNEVSTT